MAQTATNISLVARLLSAMDEYETGYVQGWVDRNRQVNDGKKDSETQTTAKPVKAA